MSRIDIQQAPAAAEEISLLFIEDSEQDLELTLRRLRAASLVFRHRCVVTEQQMREALSAETPHLILADFTLPAFDGLSALAIAREQAPDVPFIFLSGTIGEERAIEALKSGATDYILKSNPGRLVTAIRRALAEADTRRRGRHAERQVARLTRVLHMHSGINAALVRIRDRNELLTETCRLAHHVGGYAVAMVALIDPTTRSAKPVSWAGFEFLRHRDISFQVGDSEAEDTSIMGRVIRTGEAALCEDLEQPNYPILRRDALIEGGVRSLACMPLLVDGTPIGSFLCGTMATGVISRDELAMLEEVSANLSFALQYLEKQEAVQFLSYFEPLTGLAKRALFCERLDRLLARGSSRLPRLAVTVFDIEHLRVVNDSFGRHTGDRLLQCVADRLRAQFPDTEQLAHLGGGTFVCLAALPERDDPETAPVHRDVTATFDRPFIVDGRDVLLKIKSGVACFPDDGQEPDKLVQNAEAALKEAKLAGEQHLHHRKQSSFELARRVGMQQRLRSALETEQFVLHYQPKVSLHGGKITSAEALLRWRDGENGLVAPWIFLPVLESAGLMPAIGAWVLRRAAADCRYWQLMGLPPIRVAVNISPLELRRRNGASEILSAIGDLAGQANWGIDIEVTEGALSGDTSGCVHTLRLLRAAGVRVAIDDFGTGFSSLGRLSELPIDTLKIDRVFTNRLPDDKRARTLVSTIIDLAHAFDMTTVAEGVETQGQLDYLVSARCDESQGYLHSKPIPREDFEHLLSIYSPVTLNSAQPWPESSSEPLPSARMA
jgi:diguanylate cyclase (GGDEF)-like protein